MQQILKLAAFFLLFVVAATAAIELTRSTSIAIDFTEALILEKDHTITQRSVEELRTVTGSEVMHSIYHIRAINVPIKVVNGEEAYTYSPDMEPELADYSAIELLGTYTKQLVRGTNGEIRMVLFVRLREG